MIFTCGTCLDLNKMNDFYPQTKCAYTKGVFPLRQHLEKRIENRCWLSDNGLQIENERF